MKTLTRFRKKVFKTMVLDEIYSFEGRKDERIYIWTAIAFDDPKDPDKHYFYHVSTSKGWEGLQDFCEKLPEAKTYMADDAPVYREKFGHRCISGKSKWTNLIESVNSRVRHFLSSMHRRRLTYCKSVESLENRLALIFVGKIF